MASTGWPKLRAQVSLTTAPFATPSWTTIHEGTTTQRAFGFRSSMGRGFELDPFQPATAEVDLENSDRRFDPGNTAGPYFGQLLPRKRMRIQADWGTYLLSPGAAGDGGGTPDAAAFDITGDIDLRAKIAPDDWTPAAAGVIMAKANITGQFSYVLAVGTTGKLILSWSPTGALGGIIQAESTAAVPATNGAWKWVRVTLDVNNGAGGWSARFYTSPDDVPHDEVTWYQLGSTVTAAGATSIHSGSAAASFMNMEDGFSPLAGKLYAAAFLNGIGGTVVSAPDFTDGTRFTAGAFSGVDLQGVTWYPGGAGSFAAMTYDLFGGFVDRWPQDAARGFSAEAKVTATDGFKILAGVDVASAFEEVMRTAGPARWWRMGDAVPTERACIDSSGNHYDGVYYGEPGSTGSIVDGATGNAVDFDGDDDRVIFAPEGLLTAGPLSVVAWVETSSETATDPTVIWTQYRLFGIGGGATTWAPVIGLTLTGSGFASFAIRSASGNGSLAGAVDLRDGLPHMLAGTFDAARVLRLYVDGSLVGTSSALGSVTLDSSEGSRIATGPVGGSGFARFAGAIDEVAVYSSALSGTAIAAQWDAGADPWAGDLTGTRIGRFLDAAGWPSADRDIDAGDSVMGPFDSSGTTALAAMQDAEATEGGRLWMTPDGKVTFRSRHSRATDPRALRAQAVFTDQAASTAMHATQVTLDFGDDLIVNEANVEWSGGTETVVDAVSKDTYGPRSMQVRTALGSSIDARSRAQWLLSRYAQPRIRPESVTVRPSADSRLWRAALTLRLGDRVTVRRQPAAVGSVIEVDAWVESIEHRVSDGVDNWETTIGLSPTPDGVDGPGGPAVPNTFVLGDPVYGRLGLNVLG